MKSMRIRRNVTTRANYSDPVASTSASLELRTQFYLLGRITDGTITQEEMALLRDVARLDADHSTGEERLDWMAASRLTDALDGARFEDGRWRGVKIDRLRIAREFAGV